MPKRPNKKNEKLAKPNKMMKARIGLTERGMAAAYTSRMAIRGLQNQTVRVSYLAGHVRIGSTATFGLNDGVYFEPAGGGLLMGGVAANASRCWAPIAPGDLNYGQLYMRDLQKYYSRKRLTGLRMELLSLNPSTANGCIVTLGAARGSGPAQQGITQLSATATVAATSAEVTVLPTQNRIDCASYESKVLDVTHLIAGGSGARQNEFDINGDGITTIAAVVNTVTATDLQGIVPMSFIIGGTNTTAALRGTRTHEVVFELTMELIDFVGAAAQLFPVGASSPAPTPASATTATRVAALYEEIRSLSKTE